MARTDTPLSDLKCGAIKPQDKDNIL